MVAELKQVVERMAMLPKDQQVGLAYRIALDIESLEQPDAVTAQPGSLIDQLLAEAKEEDRLGLTRPLEELLDELPQ